MEIWHFWIIGALIMFIIEILTTGFAAICLSIGAIAAAVSSAIGSSLEIQLLWFSIFTLLSFVVLRPFVTKLLKQNKSERKSGIEALIGRTAIVTESIDPENNKGRIAVDGDNWKAVSEDNTFINKDSHVIITKIDSIIVTVKKSSNN